MNLRPINGYVLIEPVVHESFMAQAKETYDEIGVVIETSEPTIRNGVKVYFDSFMAKKYPNPDKADSFIWLVHKDEISAISE